MGTLQPFLAENNSMTEQFLCLLIYVNVADFFLVLQLRESMSTENFSGSSPVAVLERTKMNSDD